MPAKRRGLLVILIALFFSGALSLDKIARTFGLDGPVTVSEQSKAHILQGDETGGGHQFGAGRPCKSEFPKEWSGDDIIANVELIASNDNLPWRKQKNGYYSAEETVEGVRVRVTF
ncbi:MAG TPA: EndoU domain-containing protein [Micavibrio sp.]|nr:EndoU domain-containing protein [Micavibrio sp.]